MLYVVELDYFEERTIISLVDLELSPIRGLRYFGKLYVYKFSKCNIYAQMI